MDLTDIPRVYRPTRGWRLSPFVIALSIIAPLSLLAVLVAMNRPRGGWSNNPYRHYVSAEQAVEGWQAVQPFLLFVCFALFALGALGSLMRQGNRILVSVGA
jgi:hypothetical protein